jgi:hypothetical protein
MPQSPHWLTLPIRQRSIANEHDVLISDEGQGAKKNDRYALKRMSSAIVMCTCAVVLCVFLAIAMKRYRSTWGHTVVAPIGQCRRQLDAAHRGVMQRSNCRRRAGALADRGIEVSGSLSAR